jgi:hypothetical protein
VEALRDGAHDQILHGRPIVHDLPVPDADDVEAAQQELRVVCDVALW